MIDQKPNGALDPSREPIPVTSTPDDPFHYFNQLGRELPTSYWEGMKADASIAWQNGPANAIGRMIDLNQVEQNSGRKLHPNELNRMFPEVEQPFTEATTMPVAQEIARRARDRHELESISARSSMGGLGRFSTGLVAGAVDPINLGAALLSGGLLRAAGALSEAATVGRYAANAAIEGTSGALIPEAISGYAAQQEHQDYGVSDYLKNVGTAGLGFAGLSTAGKYLVAPAFSKGRGKINEFLSRNPEAERLSHEAAIGQLMLDRQVNVEPITKTALKDTAGSPHPGLPEYRYEAMTSGEQAQGRELYHGSDKSQGSFKESAKTPIEENFGHGVYLTDSPAVANGHASGTFTSSDGKIFQVSADHPNLNLLHLDQRLEAGVVRDTIESFVRENQTKPTADTSLGADPTLKGQLESIQRQIQSGSLPETALDDLGARLKSKGIDGYVYEGGKFLGKEGSPHNIVMLFDPEKTGDAGGIAREIGQISPESAAVERPSVSQAEDNAKAQAAPENGINYDAHAAQEYEQLFKNPPKELEIPDIKEFEGVAMEDLRAMKDQGLLTPEEEVHMSKLEELAKQAREEETTVKAALFCLGRDA